MRLPDCGLLILLVSSFLQTCISGSFIKFTQVFFALVNVFLGKEGNWECPLLT